MTIVNVTKPALNSADQRGERMTTTDGTWTFDDDYLTYDYEWYRCDAAGANCVLIPGQVSNAYVLQYADVGATIRSKVIPSEHTYPTSPTEPGPISGDGYSVVFEDDFATLDTSVWRLGNWYTPESPGNYSVSSSILSIVNKPAERKQRDLMTKSLAFQYGYFEMRARYTRNVDSWASLWMMSDNWIRTGNCTSLKVSEIDVLESFHNLENPLNYRSHSSTIHRNTGGNCGMADQFKPNWTGDCGHELADNWRTYACLWTPTTITTYVDETVCKTWPVWDTTNQPHRIFLGMWSHTYAAQVTLDVDWVRVWQQ